MKQTVQRNSGARFYWRGRMVCAVASLLILTSAAAWGQEKTLAVGNVIPVRDVLGRNWSGTSGDPDGSCRVEIRRTGTGGFICSPTNSPEAIATHNPLVTNSYLGCSVVGANPGTFSKAVAWSALDPSAAYFVRVFDRSDPSVAIYYADSSLFVRPSDEVTFSVNPEFGIQKLVSTGDVDVDTDGDGLPDAMEMEMGLDPNSADTDGDGYSDYFEALYPDYLDPNDETDPPLVIHINQPELVESDPYTVSWDTIPVPGMEYILEWTDALPYEYLFTAPVTNIIATDTNLVIAVDEWVRTNVPPKGFFRVLVPYSMP